VPSVPGQFDVPIDRVEPVPKAERHDWAGLVGSTLRPPVNHKLGPNVRGPQDQPVICQASGPAPTGRRPGRQTSRAVFEDTWWYGPTANQYADSLDDPGNVKVFQRHWIGLTPVESELVRPGEPAGPLASVEHGTLAVSSSASHPTLAATM
jgi:hypothetical protein